MSDEIKKMQQMAFELKIHEIITNIVTKAGTMPNATKAEWERCKLDSEGQSRYMGGKHFSITMPNGIVLYKADIFGDTIDSTDVTDFRYGSWVEKLKAYSEQITAEKRRLEAEKAEQEKKAKLAPFSVISDEEFEKMMNQARQS